MQRSQATFDAFDSVELQLLNGRVVHCDALTVQEAVRYLRHLSGAVGGDLSRVDLLLREFPARVGLTEVPVVDLGLEIEGLDVSPKLLLGSPLGEPPAALRRAFANAVAELADTDVLKQAQAQLYLLRLAPPALGLRGRPLVEVFEGARDFTSALYLHLFGLAQDFCSLLTRSPRVRTMHLRARTSSSALKLGSTT